MITETDEIARAIDAAAATWPDAHDDRAALLRRLIVAGSERVEHSVDERTAARRHAIERAAGALSGVYPPEAAATLKAEWPE
jgi:hypothetical protein